MNMMQGDGLVAQMIIWMALVAGALLYLGFFVGAVWLAARLHWIAGVIVYGGVLFLLTTFVSSEIAMDSGGPFPTNTYTFRLWLVLYVGSLAGWQVQRLIEASDAWKDSRRDRRERREERAEERA
jgi:hypothetical protein